MLIVRNTEDLVAVARRLAPSAGLLRALEQPARIEFLGQFGKRADTLGDFWILRVPSPLSEKEWTVRVDSSETPGQYKCRIMDHNERIPWDLWRGSAEGNSTLVDGTNPELYSIGKETYAWTATR